VNRACHQFLARAGLAQDENVRLGRSDSRDLRKDFLQRRAVPNDVSEAGPKLLFQKFILDVFKGLSFSFINGGFGRR
jgi:hypothetical protein